MCTVRKKGSFFSRQEHQLILKIREYSIDTRHPCPRKDVTAMEKDCSWCAHDSRFVRLVRIRNGIARYRRSLMVLELHVRTWRERPRREGNRRNSFHAVFA